MKKLHLMILLVFFSSSVIYSQSKTSSPETGISVKITDPTSDGFKVGRSLKVKGEAKIPPGYYLWVLCHRSDLPRWWPQNEARIDPQTGNWTVTINVGEVPDIGEDFEIIAIAVDKKASAQLRAAIGTAIDLPDSQHSALRSVNKISH
jgi:hypothetical protein